MKGRTQMTRKRRDPGNLKNKDNRRKKTKKKSIEKIKTEAGAKREEIKKNREKNTDNLIKLIKKKRERGKTDQETEKEKGKGETGQEIKKNQEIKNTKIVVRDPNPKSTLILNQGESQKKTEEDMTKKISTKNGKNKETRTCYFILEDSGLIVLQRATKVIFQKILKKWSNSTK